MTKFSYPIYPTENGYLTEKIKLQYISSAVICNNLPLNAHRVANIVSLSAPKDIEKPIQFWQLYSVLGQDTIVNIIENFYGRVYENETWFPSVFAKVGDVGHHINTQA